MTNFNSILNDPTLAYLSTNESGKRLIDNYSINIVFFFFPDDSNFFYALNDKNIALSLPYNDKKGCEATFFGDKNYLKKHLFNKYNFNL